MSDKQHVACLRVAQAAEALGVRPATIRAWVLRRRIAYHKIGSCVRILVGEIQRVLDESLIPRREVQR